MDSLHNTVSILMTVAVCFGQVFASFQTPRPTAKVEFRWAESTPGKGLTEVTVPATNEKVYLHKEPIISNKDILEARAVEAVNLNGGISRYVEVVFTKDAAERMAKATREHSGRLLAILVDGKIISVPVVHGTIYERAAISSEMMTKKEAERIASALNQVSHRRTR